MARLRRYILAGDLRAQRQYAVAAERSYSACAFRVALDENEREHTKTGKRDRDEETTGNEVIKCPHDPNPVV